MINLNEQSFTFETWRNGNISELINKSCRKENLIQEKELIIKYAFGYCKADNIPCRPKKEYIAVMFFKKDSYDYWWTHFSKIEFEQIFKIKI